MKSIIVMLTVIGVIGLIIGYINQIKTCPPPRVEYRYIPRSFEDDQNDPVKITQLFKNMFEQPTPWLMGTRLGYIKPNIFKINRFNISQ